MREFVTGRTFPLKNAEKEIATVCALFSRTQREKTMMMRTSAPPVLTSSTPHPFDAHFDKKPKKRVRIARVLLVLLPKLCHFFRGFFPEDATFIKHFLLSTNDKRGLRNMFSSTATTTLRTIQTIQTTTTRCCCSFSSSSSSKRGGFRRALRGGRRQNWIEEKNRRQCVVRFEQRQRQQPRGGERR